MIVRTARSPAAIVATVCAAEILGMTTFSMFLALQPQLQREWELSNTASGWISSAFYAGYMVAVPVLASLTDRFDARRVWLTAITFAAAGALGLAAIGQGPATAALCQALAGAGLAGTYMPGLKVIDDRLPGVLHPRLVAFYTTSFSLGSSGSYFLVGQLAETMPWRAAVATLAIGPALGWLLVWLFLEHAPPHPENVGPVHSARWGEVIRSADSMRYVVAYACHTWELFGMRAWLVPFLVFCAVRQGPTFAAPATLAAMLSLAGIPASFAGAELSARFDRRHVIGAIMLTSAATGIVVGMLTSQVWPLILTVSLLHHALVMGDSAALTSGLVAISPAQSRGTAMAVYSMAGFAAAAAASFAIGGVLDLFGGQSATSWAVAFVVMVSANVLGATVLWRSHRPESQRRFR